MRSRAGFLSVALFAVAFPSFAYRMSAWVPSWDSKALTSMQLNAGKLDEANPGWYTISADGLFTKNYKAEDPTMRAALTGTDLLPTIKNYVNGKFDGALVAAVLSTPDMRAKHAEALAQLVAQNAYDGIDIDYENMTSAARANFTAFVQLLAQKLHAAGKKLSVTVDAKTSDTDSWSGPAGEDWRAIGAVADTVKIMAYDAHWDGSAAGAITPLDWLDSVASYAEATLPSGKAIIGLPWYGYDWQGTSAAALTYGEAMALARAQGATVTHDGNGEATFTYGAHTVYFQDAAAYSKKVELITSRHPRIAGFAHWRAGSEDPGVWSTVSALRHGTTAPSTPATPAAASFTISGPASLAAAAGQASRASYRLVAINGFSGTADVTVVSSTFPGTITITSSATPTSAAVLTVVPNVTARAGTYSVRLRMTSGSLVSEVTVSVAVQPVSGRRRSVAH